jgi:hypothetical protein
LRRVPRNDYRPTPMAELFERTSRRVVFTDGGWEA